MRIALNARILQAPRTGIGHYVAELVNALAQEPDVDLALFHGWGWNTVLRNTVAISRMVVNNAQRRAF